jgi:hypothetical protein
MGWKYAMVCGMERAFTGFKYERVRASVDLEFGAYLARSVIKLRYYAFLCQGGYENVEGYGYEWW